MRPPTMAVMRPPNGGNPLAIAIPRQRGKAIRETNSPEVTSFLKFSLNPLIPSAGIDEDTGVKAAERSDIGNSKKL
jgi:hypothetical protein